MIQHPLTVVKGFLESFPSFGFFPISPLKFSCTSRLSFTKNLLFRVTLLSEAVDLNRLLAKDCPPSDLAPCPTIRDPSRDHCFFGISRFCAPLTLLASFARLRLFRQPFAHFSRFSRSSCPLLSAPVRSCPLLSASVRFYPLLSASTRSLRVSFSLFFAFLLAY